MAEGDALPLTLVAKVAEGCLREGNRPMVAEELEEEEGDPSVVLVSMVVAEVEQPSHDASHGVADDEQLGETVGPSWASEVEPTEARLRTVDEACPLDSVDSERPTIVPQHCRVVLL